jgi:hypothetical protein
MIQQKQLELPLKVHDAAASLLLTKPLENSGTLHLKSSLTFRTAPLFAERHGSGVQACEQSSMCIYVCTGQTQTDETTFLNNK